MLLTCNDKTCRGSRSCRGKKHFSGGEAYGVVPACPHRGLRPGGGLPGRGRAAGRDRPQGRLGHRDISGAGTVGKARAAHDPGKILLDVALAVALGGDCLADMGMLRAESAVFGLVASDPTVSRLIDTLGAAGPKALNRDPVSSGRSASVSGSWLEPPRRTPPVR